MFFCFTLYFQDKCESIFKAVQEGDEEGFYILLESVHELISSKNTRGQSLLHVAVLHEETEMIKHILETSPESHKAKDNVRNIFGNSFLDVIFFNEFSSLFALQLYFLTSKLK